MDESGYCDAMSQHSNNAGDESTITVTVEPVDVTIEKDGSVLLSALQSALPGAHGLYYRQLGQKKAIKYDSRTARIMPPLEGWGARSYFVTLAHGCNTTWTAFGSYETASRQFERSVTAVQKMLGGFDSADYVRRTEAGADAHTRLPGKRILSQANSVASDADQDAVKSVVRDTESLVPEKRHALESQVDELSKTLAAKEHEIQLLKEANHELRSRSDSPAVCVGSAENENAKQSLAEFSRQLDEAESRVKAQEEELQSLRDISRDKEELRAQIDGLLEQLDNTQSRFNELEHSSADQRQKLEWETGEMRQQWNDAKWRIGELESVIEAKDAENVSKSDRIAHLESELNNISHQLRDANQNLSRVEAERTSTISSLQSVVDGGNEELSVARQRLAEVSASADKYAEESRHANERVSQLGQELNELRVQVEESAVKVEHTRLQQSSANDVQERVRDLEKQLADLQDSYNQLEQDSTSMRQKLEWELGETNQWLNGAKHRVGELEEDLRTKSGQLDEKQHIIDNLNTQLETVMQELKTVRNDEVGKLVLELNQALQTIDTLNARTAEINEQDGLNDDAVANKQTLIDELTHQLEVARKELEDCKWTFGELQSQHAEVCSKKDYVERELSAAKKHLANGSQNQPRRNSDPRDDALELSDELIKANMRMYELESQAAQMSADLKFARQRAEQLESAQQETTKNLWLTGERLSELEREKHRLQHELHEAHRIIDQLNNELSQQNNRVTQNLPEVHQLHEELRTAREHLASLSANDTEARQKLEWQLGEVTQEVNDAKWRIGEMEAHSAHKQWELDQARCRVHELEQLLEKLQNFKSKATKVLEGSFLIRKQPYVDRTKWSLSMWDENTPADGDLDYRRVWFDIDAPNARNVYLMGSFVNWECGLMCTATDYDENKKGVWVDLPRGRYEYRFLVDGDWRTAAHFPTCHNDFGTENNWRFVE